MKREQFDLQAPPQTLGEMTGYRWATDPKGLCFTLARYKFVAKMLEGRGKVLEVGCGDGWPSKIVQQCVGMLVCTDVRPADVPHFRQHDMLSGPMSEQFDAAYALDVLEHVQPEAEGRFLANIAASVTDYAPVIIGMPSLESQQYASRLSKIGHVNCKTQAELKKTMARHFRTVLMFGMNDEVLHTGYGPMCHYILGLGIK